MGGKSQPDELVQTSTSSGTTSNRQLTDQIVNVPEFLRPFIGQSSDVGSAALGDLQQLLGGPLVADFNADQTQGFDLARGVA